MLSLPLSSFPRPNFVFSRVLPISVFLLLLSSVEHHKNNVTLSFVVMMLSSFPLPNYVLSRESPISGMFRWESHQPSSLHHFVITIQHNCQDYILSSNFNSLCYYNSTSLSSSEIIIKL